MKTSARFFFHAGNADEGEVRSGAWEVNEETTSRVCRYDLLLASCLADAREQNVIYTLRVELRGWPVCVQ